ETYHQQPQSETGLTPPRRWETNAFLPRLPTSLEQLDLLLLTVAKPRRVHQDGIHFQGFRYLDTTLAAYVGEDVIIRYDPRDIAELRVYFGDSFLCRAINPELAGETIGLKDIIRARNQRRRELRTTLAAREATVEAVAGLGKTVSARQYAHWDQLESVMGGPPPYRHRETPPRESGPWRTVLFTPGVTNTPRTVEHAVSSLWGTVDGLGAHATWYGD